MKNVISYVCTVILSLISYVCILILVPALSLAWCLVVARDCVRRCCR